MRLTLRRAIRDALASWWMARREARNPAAPRPPELAVVEYDDRFEISKSTGESWTFSKIDHDKEVW